MIEQIPISELNNNLMEDTSQICSIYGHLMKMSSTLHSCKNVNLYSFIKTKSKFFLQYYFVTPFFFTRALLITKARAYSGQCHIIIILITMRQTVFFWPIQWAGWPNEPLLFEPNCPENSHVCSVNFFINH